MKLFSGMFGRKSNSEDDMFPDYARRINVEETKAKFAEDLRQQTAAEQMGKADEKMVIHDMPEAGPMEEGDQQAIETVLDNVDTPEQKSVNIWDMDDSDDSTEDVAAAPAPKPAPAPKRQDATLPPGSVPGRASSRARRNRTRLIGFDKSDGEVVDLFQEAPAAPRSDAVRFPVGWVLVVDGPGRGHCFALTAGMAQIGRGEDQSIQLDFGDNAISRNNHAAIVYDSESRQFLLGHGGKSNIVRLNGKPVISNEDLKDGDLIKIGDTTLKIKTLCGSDFDWSDAGGDEEREDVAIA